MSEQGDCLCEAVFRALVPEITSFQVCQIGFAIDLTDRQLNARQLVEDSTCNGAGDLTLDAQHILQVAFVGLTPDHGMVADLKQLRRNRYPLSGNAHTAFENVVGTDVLGDAIEVTRGISRAQSDDAHFIGMKLPEPGDHFLGESVSDKVLAGIATHVLKGPDGQSHLARRGPNPVVNLGPVDPERYRRS